MVDPPGGQEETTKLDQHKPSQPAHFHLMILRPSALMTLVVESARKRGAQVSRSAKVSTDSERQAREFASPSSG